MNPICIIAYFIVLFKFFKDRILIEEPYLITFFGQDYIDYKRKVPILIPFIEMSEEEEKIYLNKYNLIKEREKLNNNDIKDYEDDDYD